MADHHPPKFRGPLAQITADAVDKAVLEFDKLGRDQFLKQYKFGKAKEYYLVLNGARYDSKAIVGAAYQHVSEDGKPLKKFPGGERTVGRLLTRLGFEVEKISSGLPQPNFERGRIYSRRNDIHAPFGGQQQGGIATPLGPYVFLFTGQQGTNYGYHDGKRTDGVFEYTGEGQTGDMQFIKGNKAIRDHAADGKDLLLFETLKAKGKCRYMGSFVCDGWTIRTGKDKTGANRKIIVFDLVPAENLEPANLDLHEPPDPRISLDELRKRAYAAAASPTGSQGQSKRNVYARSRDVRNWVLARAKGICEACNIPAPFERTDGTPYLEPHHTRRLSDGGPDHPRWVGAICPTCHRKIHHGIDGPKLNETLQAHLSTLEKGNP